MTLLVQKVFRGEVPRVPDYLLVDGASKFALNCDLQHGSVAGVQIGCGSRCDSRRPSGSACPEIAPVSR